MDYRDQDNNNESLFGARNENSVLFSLDSLQSMDGESNSGGTNPSGDASGLINLSTLSAMSRSEDGDDAGNESYGMQSMVFNEVVPKNTRRKMQILVGTFIGVILLATVGGVLGYRHMDQKNKEEIAQTQAAEEEARQSEKEKSDQKIKELEDALAQKNLEAAKQNADLQKELQDMRDRNREREEQQKINEALAASDSNKAAKSTGSSAKKATPPAGAEAVATGKAQAKPPSAAEVKEALAACNKKATKCAKDGTLVVQMSINSSGSAKNVKAVGGTFQGTATEKCILTVVEKHPFPTFSGAAIPVKYTFKL